MGGLNADSAIIHEMGVLQSQLVIFAHSISKAKNAARLTNGEFGTTATFTAVVAATRPAVPPALRHWRKGRDSAKGELTTVAAADAASTIAIR
jgi:hypothetical protein